MKKRVLFVFYTLTILPISAFSQQPPKPAQSVDTLFMPAKVQEEPTQEAVSLPVLSRLAFSVNINGVDPGQYLLKGTVLAFQDQSIRIQTPDQGEATFAFRLPADMKLKVRENEQVAITHIPVFEGASKGYDLSLEAGQELRLKSGKVFGQSPIRIQLARGLALIQEASKETAPNDAFFLKAPVFLSMNGQRIRIPLQERTEFQMGNSTYELFLQSSYLRIAREAVFSERSGYTLQYVLNQK